jgi:phosphoserine phosphatase RsbU/P
MGGARSRNAGNGSTRPTTCPVAAQIRHGAAARSAGWPTGAAATLLGRRASRWSWPLISQWPLHAGTGIWLEPAGPVPRGIRGARLSGLVLATAVTVLAAVQFVAGRPFTTLAWLAMAPLLASLVLPPRLTALLAGWTVLLGLGLMFSGTSPGRLVSRLTILMLLAGFAVANSILRSAAQRRLAQARAVARVAQSALLRDVPKAVTAAQLASRYLSASSAAKVGGDVLEVVADGPAVRWLVDDTRGNGLPAVRLASVAATSFRDACAEPGLSLAEIARAVDPSVTRAAEEEDFVTAVFAELDPGGWVQLVICGHPPPMRLTLNDGLEPLTPAVFATPLGLHPDLHLSTFAARTGDRLLFYTDGLLEARDRDGRFFRLDEHIDTLRLPSPQAAVDQLLDQLRTHTRHGLDDDVAVLLVELDLTGPDSGAPHPASRNGGGPTGE